ncbi:phage tail length tape measure family protein [Aquimarina sp. 2201CG14-23]|uniref:phage tail length tape measure family protein n=1 Tax=Aquimarina mycalae TaxID=3040073 RepID=UPI002477F86B|nr:phage tail length tape measure family protein [Aquimarina sp. 2201CG14-23]MDH7444680.1 phage tail length tape measure family protein [Aquimarina sp. 2201CG14-23]
MAAPIVNIKFLADLKQFSTGMQNASRKMDNLGRKIKKVGVGLSVGLTAPIVALGFESAKAFDKQSKAIAQVEQGLLSTGNAVGYTSDQLQGLASDLQSNSLFGDEEILKSVTAQLLTFTNIANEQFGRTQQAALDLATRLDGDLKSASIQLGKALNDPIANLSALSRSGIQFSEDQKKVINSLVQSNRLAEAQSIILNELEKQYGGSAAAAAKAGTGPFKQLSNIIGDISEDFGKIIVEALLPFVENIKSIATGFKNLSPETKKFIVIIGGIAAAIGPLLALAGTILPAILTGFTILTGPIGLVVAALTAIGVIIAKNWEPIKGTLVDIANYFIDLYNESVVFRTGVEVIITTFKNVFRTGKFVFNALGDLISLVAGNIKNAFVAVGDLIKAVLTGNFEDIPNVLSKTFAKGLNNLKDFSKSISEEFNSLKTDIDENLKEGINNALNRRAYKLDPDNVDLNPFKDTIQNAVKEGINSGFGNGQDRTPQVESVGDLTSLDVTSSDLSIAGINFEGMNTSLDEFASGVELRLADIREKAEQFRQLMQETLGEGLTNVFDSFARSFTNSLGLAENGLEGFLKVLIQGVTEIISAFLAQSIAGAIAGGTQAGAATGPAAVGAIPAFIAQLTGVVLSAFAAIPQFATGGIVGGSSYYGDKILARLNSGELILNKAQQKNLSNQIDNTGVKVNLFGNLDIEGEKIRFLLDKVDNRINRIG